MSESIETQKMAGMCSHGNFPSKCSYCAAEAGVDVMAENVLNAMGLDWNFLEGKKVLEIGPGLAEFAQAAKKRGIEVISLEKNPDLWKEDGEIPTNVEYIVGDATDLPFEDESLDVLISKAAPPTISQTKEEVEKVLSEAMRVLKVGGVFRFGPARMVCFGDLELFTPDEEESFDKDQRAERVLEKSLEFLQALYPAITRVSAGHEDGVYELVK